MLASPRDQSEDRSHMGAAVSRQSFHRPEGIEIDRAVDRGGGDRGRRP
jgi:hypothetical protein